jgi:hypothetical protein
MYTVDLVNVGEYHAAFMAARLDAKNKKRALVFFNFIKPKTT